MAYLKESYVATFNWLPFFLGVFSNITTIILEKEEIYTYNQYTKIER